MFLLVATTGPPRTSAQLFPFTSLRHIFDNLKFRGGGNSVARLHSENDPLPAVRPVLSASHFPLHPSSTTSAPTIFLVDPESHYRRIELNRSRHLIPIAASSNISEQKSPAHLKTAMPPVPSSYLQPPLEDLPLRVDLSKLAKIAAEKGKSKSSDNSAAGSQDTPKNYKRSTLKKVTNHRLETDLPANHKKKAPSINTPRNLVEAHPTKPAAEASMNIKSTHRIVKPVPVSVAPVKEPVHSASHIDVPEGGDERVEFQMHGLQGPKSYKFGYDTGRGQNRQFRYEERDEHGNVRGHYGYMDDDGKLQVVNYKADPHTGYHADISKLHL